MTTQWRAQACGFAGDPNARTPELDSLAAQGVNFAAAVTPHPFSPFARAALLTGTPSPENGVAGYFDPLPKASRTIAHALGDLGYDTAFFGKWHLAGRDPAAPLVGEAHARTVVPADSRGGFGFWEGFESGFLLNDPWLHGSRISNPTRFPGYQSDVLCERAAAWISGKDGSRPWFCVVSLEPPHPPYDAPAAGIARRDSASLTLASNVPLGGEIERRARRELAGYYAHLEATDRAIGRLVRSAPASAGTALVVTSVHGDMHGAHGLFRKGWPHEESIRVPLIVHPPGKAAAPGRRDALVSLLDLPRWALSWAAGREADFSSPVQAISMPCAVPFPDQCDRPWRGIRTPDRKLVLNSDGSPWLFFDLRNDPLEERNLAADPGRSAEIADLTRTGSCLGNCPQLPIVGI